MAELPARERIILAVDTSERSEAERLLQIASDAGATSVKLGLELSSATSWGYCSELAANQGLNWVADAKLDDIPNTVAKAVTNIASLEHPPFAITMHTTAGFEAMNAAQEAAGTIKMLGVTILTSIQPQEAVRTFSSRIEPSDVLNLHEIITTRGITYHNLQGLIDDYFKSHAEERATAQVMSLADSAHTAGLKGIVCSPKEVKYVKGNLFTKDMLAMIPGIRSATADTQDQARVATPATAIKSGADLLVIGRQVTQAVNPAEEYEKIVEEIEGAI